MFRIVSANRLIARRRIDSRSKSVCLCSAVPLFPSAAMPPRCRKIRPKILSAKAEADVPFVRKIAISETAVTPQGYSKSAIYGCQEAASKRGSFKSPFHLHKCPAPLKIPCVCCIILLNLKRIACVSNSIQTRRNKKCFAQIAETTSLMQTHRSAPTAVLS